MAVVSASIPPTGKMVPPLAWVMILCRVGQRSSSHSLLGHIIDLVEGQASPRISSTQYCVHVSASG